MGCFSILDFFSVAHHNIPVPLEIKRDFISGIAFPFEQKKSYLLIKKDHDSPPRFGFFETKKSTKHLPPGEEAEEADLWLIFLRFALQPCRVFASAANARKVQQMQKGCVA